MERTLLLVDDEENIISALTRLLRRGGYRILSASSGKEGLALLEQNEVGVIISDQRMPEMTGTEFLSKVKELYPDTVRIVLSGYTELKSVTDAINQGAIYKFLTKPWEDDLLCTNVDEAFRHYEMKQENVRLELELRKANEELQLINQGLEQIVEERIDENMRNLGVLQVSQEVLEHLPVAVIGIGEDGIIVIANQMAQQIFGSGGTRSLLGEEAKEILPQELITDIRMGEDAQGKGKNFSLADGREFYCQCKHTGLHSQSNGIVLSCIPNVFKVAKDNY
ncbi:MAG: response regulator [Gallionellaceae bacterium]|nr:response regulator [Gallionellaceae bacterium]